MAATDILRALQEAQMQPIESGYGMGANALGMLGGAAMNPRRSSSANLGIGVGSALLQGLLSGLARRDAATQNAGLYEDFKRYQAGDESAVANNPRLQPLAIALASGKAEAEADKQAKLGLLREELKIKREGELPFETKLDQERQIAEAKAAAKAKYAPASAPKLSFEQELEQLKMKKRTEAEVEAEIAAKFPKAATPKELGAEMAGKLMSSKAVIDEANVVASEIEKLSSWGDYQTSKYFSGMDQKGVALTLANLADAFARARTGAAMNQSETDLYNKLVGGDLSADPKQSAMLLRKLAKAETRMSRSKVEAFQKLSDPKQALDLFPEDPTAQEMPEVIPVTDASAPPPAGYKLQRNADGTQFRYVRQ